MMKAVRLHEFGGPDVLRYDDAPIPALAAGGVLVRVHAGGLKQPDWYLRDGYQALPLEWRPQPSFRVGDEVYSMVRFVRPTASPSRLTRSRSTTAPGQ